MAADIDAREIRWFFDGTVPEKVSAWFKSGLTGVQIEKERPREDLYLIWNGRDNVGLKFREGELELKLRQSAQDVKSVDGRAVGVEERWEKMGWQYDHGQIDEVLRRFSTSGQKGERVNVSKVRQRGRYELDSSGRLKPVNPRERPARVVVIELTDLTVDGKQAWTLAFDVIGPANELSDIRFKAIEILLRDYPGPELTLARSYGYPRWLQSQFGRGR